MQSDERMLADENMYDEAFVKNRKIVDLQKQYEVISDEEEEDYIGEDDEYKKEEMYEVKKIDVGTQCNLIMATKRLKKWHWKLCH